MALIKIDLSQFEDAVEGIKMLEERIDTTKVLDDAAAALFNRTRDRFLRKVDPDEVPWKPSKAGLKREAGGYTTRNGRKFSGTGTLFESGALFHSIQLYSPDANTRAIGTDVEYAGFHQNGKGRNKRPFLGISKDDETLFENIVMREVDEALK